MPRTAVINMSILQVAKAFVVLNQKYKHVLGDVRKEAELRGRISLIELLYYLLLCRGTTGTCGLSPGCLQKSKEIGVY